MPLMLGRTGCATQDIAGGQPALARQIAVWRSNSGTVVGIPVAGVASVTVHKGQWKRSSLNAQSTRWTPALQHGSNQCRAIEAPCGDSRGFPVGSRRRIAD